MIVQLVSFDELMSQCGCNISAAANDGMSGGSEFDFLETIELNRGDVVEFSSPVEVIPIVVRGNKEKARRKFFQGRFLKYDDEASAYVFFGIPDEDRPPFMDEVNFVFTITIKKGGIMVKKR